MGIFKVLVELYKSK